METYLSILAIIISIIALTVSCNQWYYNGRPYFKLDNLLFLPKEFHCYTTSTHLPNGYKELSEENRDIIKESKHSVSMKNIDNDHYLLFNLLGEESNMENVRLVLAPMICSYLNTGSTCNSIILSNAKSKLKDDNGRVSEYNINGELMPSEAGVITIKVAYACKEGQSTSLFYEKLLKIENGFDYLNNKQMAKSIINFEMEEFEFKCLNHKKSKYKMNIKLKMDYINGLKYEIS